METTDHHLTTGHKSTIEYQTNPVFRCNIHLAQLKSAGKLNYVTSVL